MHVIELALETYDDKEVWRSLIIQAMILIIVGIRQQKNIRN